MKHLKLIIALFVVTALIFSCKQKESKTSDTPGTETKKEKRALSELLTATEMQALTDDISGVSANAKAKGGNGQNNGKKPPKDVTVAVAPMFLTSNGSNSYTIDYGGATDVIWMFFRGGDTLYANGNVIPQNSQSFYLNPVTTFTTWVTGYSHYQSVVVTGSLTPDANGVVGADWVVTYTNRID